MIGNSEIINKFFTKELSKITEKYNKLEGEKIRRIENLMNNISDEELKEQLYLNFDEAMKLSDELGYDFEESVLNLYMFISKNGDFIDIKKAQDIYSEVSYNGYYIDQDIIIYSRLQDIEEYVRDNIHDIMSNSYEVDRIFDKDTLIDYLIEGKSIEDIERELIENYDDYENILDITPELICTNKNNRSLYYAKLNI